MCRLFRSQSRLHQVRLATYVGLAVLIWTTAVRADGIETIFLRSGDQLSGTSRGPENGTMLWEMPGGEIMRIPLGVIDRIEYGQPPAGEKFDVAASAGISVGDDEENPISPEVAGSGPVTSSYFDSTYDYMCRQASDWIKRLELGGRFLDGNSDQDFLNVMTLFEREQHNRFAQLELGGQYGSSRGELSTNRWYTNGTVDFYREGNWILFVTSKNEYDEFEGLDYRGIFSSGLGYRFFNEDRKRLLVRIGPGVTFEKFAKPERFRTTPDIFAEMELRWPLFERTSLESKTRINPSVEDFETFRLVSNNGFMVQLDSDKRWHLKFGFRFEHNSRPNDNRRRSDYTTSVLLVYTRG